MSNAICWPLAAVPERLAPHMAGCRDAFLIAVVFGFLGLALATRLLAPTHRLLRRAGFTDGEITQDRCGTTPTSENA